MQAVGQLDGRPHPQRIGRPVPADFPLSTLQHKHQSRPFSSAATSLIHSLSTSSLDIHFQDLPPVEPPLTTDGPEDFISLFIQYHNHHIKEATCSSSIPVSALFIDFFATSITDVANELRMPTYVSFASPALTLGLMLHLPILVEKIDMAFQEVGEGIQLPGIGVMIPGISMPSALTNKKSKNYTWFVYHGRRFREAKGIIVNTFEELEHEPLRMLAKGQFVPDLPTPPIYPVGPCSVSGWKSSQLRR